MKWSLGKHNLIYSFKSSSLLLGKMMKLCDHFIDTADILQMENKHGQLLIFKMIFRVKRRILYPQICYLKEKTFIFFFHMQSFDS